MGSKQPYPSNAIDRPVPESELRAALQQGALEIHYLPQISLDTGKIVGVEAVLLRKHPHPAALSPLRFIPLTDHSDLAELLGQYTLREACRQLRAWRTEGIDELRITINIPPTCLQSSRLIEQMKRAMREFDADPGRIELSIAEEALLADQKAALTGLMQWKALGLNIAIDHFGSHAFTLGFLARMPVDSLRIDPSIVLRLAEHGHDEVVTLAIIALAHALGLKAVAGGIETQAQLKFLRMHHCNEGQGFLFGNLLPAEQVVNLIGHA